MDKETLYQYFYSVISSSTKNPKYMSISTVKAANLLGVAVSEIEQYLNEFVLEGRLKATKLDDPPHHDIYFIP